MPEPQSRMEEASLYVLDLLEPEARRGFEAELEARPELRRHVDDLRVNLEALALAAPPMPPPARVWQRIADRVDRETPAPAAATAPVGSGFWRWLANGWAVAGATAAVFFAYLLFQPGTRVARNDTPPGALPSRWGGAGPERDRGQGREEPGRPAPPSTGSRDRKPPATGSLAMSARTGPDLDDTDRPRLQDRVRDLADQVATLTRVLGQPAVLPGGASRLQVFRLVATNAASEVPEIATGEPRRFASARPEPNAMENADPASVAPPPATTSTVDVSLALALSTARQWVSPGDPPAKPQAPPTGDSLPDDGLVPPTESGPLVSRAHQDATATAPPGIDEPRSTEGAPGAAPIQVVDLAPLGTGNPAPGVSVSTGSPGSGADATAFGAYSPDTGQGAVAFRVPAETGEPGAYQLWMTDTQTGITQSLGIANTGVPSASPQVLVLRFALDSGSASVAAPTFLITREPVGGSPVPTGPVIALPPPVTSLLPNP